MHPPPKKKEAPPSLVNLMFGDFLTCTDQGGESDRDEDLDRAGIPLAGKEVPEH